MIPEHDSDLDRLPVELVGVEMVDMDLPSAEHAEVVTVDLAPGEVQEALVTAAVDVGAAEPAAPDRHLDLGRERRVARRSVHVLLSTLERGVHVRVAARLIG